ncbi:hypothetical protein KIN20_018287 [Parelaphostrongylus tenuis]|uniref:Uncharacterized protein n=1 Tax=Parelaphostrongylus tenuis TaxID=148309 RepID=A0AAD5QS28_PARTN|nr:hypothetical protein KIN20_018287 [Parelaphostrongylus tenuis]
MVQFRSKDHFLHGRRFETIDQSTTTKHFKNWLAWGNRSSSKLEKIGGIDSLRAAQFVKGAITSAEDGSKVHSMVSKLSGVRRICIQTRLITLIMLASLLLLKTSFRMEWGEIDVVSGDDAWLS